MKVYVDSKYHCHISDTDGIFREVEETFFDDKCQTFIEGYCYDDSNGYVQVYPWKSYSELETAQREYERQLIAIYEKSLETVGVVL